MSADKPTPGLVQRAINFYEGSPDGQYDEIAVQALRHYLATLQAQPAEVSDAAAWELWLRVCAESDNLSTRVMIVNFARAILALRPQSESEQEKELRRSLAEAQATISERNAEIIELQKRIRRSPQAVPMTDEQALGYWKIAAKASSRYSPAEAYYKGIADAEAHHFGITAPAGGEKQA